MLHVDVRDNNVDQALRVLKKKMQREMASTRDAHKRILREAISKKARQAKEAIKRKRKADRIRAAKMGL